LREAYPDHYRIHLGEQVRRLGRLLAAGGRALTGRGTPDGTGNGVDRRDSRNHDRPAEAGGKHDRDRFREPLFLALWYAGLLTGYLQGPARSRSGRGAKTGNREERAS
jgi:hypothetical protein